MSKYRYFLTASAVSLWVVAAPALAQSTGEKAAALVDRMTPDEQLDLVKSTMPAFEKTRAPDALISAGYVPGNARLEIPALKESDAGIGVANLLNKRTDDVATSLPSGLAVAASWDSSIAYDGGRMIGSEARSKGFNVLLAGAVNLVRDPRNGRNFEYAGEDPLLAGIMAGNAIKGVQSNHILSTVKHFALNDQETGRNVLNARIDEASLRESDLLAFELAIEIGKPASVMCGYNRINGDYACENAFLLNTVLKGDWGYKGWVMSDWGAVHSTTKAALAGLDHQSAYRIDSKPYFAEPLKNAIASGEVPAARLRDMNLRIVRSIFDTGLMDEPVPATAQEIDYKSNGAISQKAAEAGIVLLKNDGGLLPLAVAGKTVAVIGGHADVGVLSGGGSSQVRPVGGPALEITPPGSAAAFARITYLPSSPLKALQARFPTGRFTFDQGNDPAAAAALAATSDLVIVFATQWTTESEDVPNMHLPDNQDALINAVARANKRVIVVLETGGPVAMPWKDQVAAIIEAWYPGSNGGDAISRVLSGDVDAQGRLPVTFPVDVGQLPRTAIPGLVQKTNSKGQITYGLDYSLKQFDVDYTIEGANVGYRWFEHRGLKPLYPFGHGLSYGRFAYSGFKGSTTGVLAATVTVRNTSARPAVDTPQVYAMVAGRDGKTVRRLAGWSRVSLAPGESKTVTVAIDPRVLANFDTGLGKWHVKSGRYRLVLAKSASNTAATTELRVDDMVIAP